MWLQVAEYLPTTGLSIERDYWLMILESPEAGMASDKSAPRESNEIIWIHPLFQLHIVPRCEEFRGFSFLTPFLSSLMALVIDTLSCLVPQWPPGAPCLHPYSSSSIESLPFFKQFPSSDIPIHWLWLGLMSSLEPCLVTKGLQSLNQV